MNDEFLRKWRSTAPEHYTQYYNQHGGDAQAMTLAFKTDDPHTFQSILASALNADAESQPAAVTREETRPEKPGRYGLKSPNMNPPRLEIPKL